MGSRAWLVLFALGVLWPQLLVGQSVRGRVLDDANGQVVANARIQLIDTAGDTLSAFATDSRGRYEIALPSVGSYRLVAEQLGYERLVSATFELLDPAGVVSLDLRLRPTPIPISGVEVSTDRVNRRLREFLGVSPGQLRIRPIREASIRDHASRGNSLSEMIRWQQIPNLRVLPAREGACYEFRGRGCMPVYLDGARLGRVPDSSLPLEMLNSVVVLLPNEVIAYPTGAIHLYTHGFMR